MSLQGLSLRKVARIEIDTGLTILRGVLNNAGTAHPLWLFTTVGDCHGWYDPRDHTWGYHLGGAHTSLCRDLFGAPLRPRDDTWGVVCPDGTWRVLQAGSRVPTSWIGLPGWSYA